MPEIPVLNIDSITYNIRDNTARTSLDVLKHNFAEEFSSSKAYSVGDYVTYTDGKFYKFKADHAAGAWNSAHVSEVTTADEVSDLKSALSAAMSASVKNGQDTFFGLSNFQPGGLETDGSLKPQQKWRISNTIPIIIYRDITIKVKSGIRWGYIPFVGGSAGSWRGWFTEATTIPAGTSFVLQIARVTEDTSETATVNEFVGALSFDGIGIVNSNHIKTVEYDLISAMGSGTKSLFYEGGEHIVEYPFVNGNRYTFENDTDRGTGAIRLYKQDDTYDTIADGIAAGASFTFVAAQNYYKFRVYINGNGGTFSVYDHGIVQRIDLSNTIAKRLEYDIVPFLSWEQGSINGQGNPTTNLTVIRTQFFDIEGIEKLILAPVAYKLGWHLYDGQFNHISSAPAYVTSKVELLVGAAKYVRFNIALLDGSDFTPADFDKTGLSIKIGYLNAASFISGQLAESEYVGNVNIRNKFRNTVFVPALKGLFTPTATLPTRRQQGTAIYNGVMFNLFDKGGVSILDLINRNVIAEYTVDVASEDNHMNSGGFGSVFYPGNTKYPLLYISECYGNHSCFVENVTDSGAELVQTITFTNANGDYTNSGSNNAFDWIIDASTDKLMTYGVMVDGKHKIKVFNVPSTETATVTLTENDVLEEWIVEDYAKQGFSYIYQGSCADGGTIYLVCYNPNKIICVDEITHKITAEIPLGFVSGEPEGIGIYGGAMFLTTWNNADTTIYAMQFDC